MMKQAQQMQKKISESQEKLKSIDVEGVSGGGSVKVVTNAKGDIKKILIDEEDVTDKTVSLRASKGLAYLPQEPSVFGRLTVEENILAALEQRRDINKEQKQRELERLVEEFQLKRFLKTKSINLCWYRSYSSFRTEKNT